MLPVIRLVVVATDRTGHAGNAEEGLAKGSMRRGAGDIRKSSARVQGAGYRYDGFFPLHPLRFLHVRSRRSDQSNRNNGVLQRIYPGDKSVFRHYSIASPRRADSCLPE